MKLKFIGAAQEVTGSKTQITYRDKTFLVDCGLFQGPRELREQNWQDIPKASSFEAVFLTHAHIDHCGYLPRLVNQGFNGPIICTAATAALVRVLLTDSAHLQEEDAQYANEKGYSNHRPARPLYTIEDVGRTLRLIETVERDQWIEISPGLSYRLLRSGHLIGSSFIQFSFSTGENSKIITFSGDLGSDRSHIIKGPVQVQETDYLVMEGTYGDKVHKVEGQEQALAQIIHQVHSRKGVLLIPAFAVGRTQELLFMLAKLEDEKKIPHLPVFVDSPMALKATEIYTKYKDDLKWNLVGDKLITSMDGTRFKGVESPAQSRALMHQSGAMIIISAAGMLTGGRILHHLKARLPHRANALLFVGFQAQGTKGRLLQNGIDKINIHHEEIKVEATIESLGGFSAHADSAEIVEWVKGFTKKPIQVFLNHGEKEPLRALKYRLQGEVGLMNIAIPFAGEEFTLE